MNICLQKIYCCDCNKCGKLTDLKISYIFDKTFVFTITCSKVEIITIEHLKENKV